MSNWNFDISQAPRGHYEEDTLPGRSGSTRTVRRFVSERVIIATKDKKVLSSRWSPPDPSERRPNGRWEMIGTNEEPVAWMPWPKHPRENTDV